MNRSVWIVILLLVLIFQVSAGKQTVTAHPKKPDTPSQVTVAWAKRALQGFNMKVWISNQMALGIQAWDGNTPDGFGLEYPTGSGIEHLYGAGPWIGAMIDGIARVTEGYNGDDARKEILPHQGDTITQSSQMSDKEFFCTATDTFHTPIIPGHFPMGVKVSQKSYAWQPAISSEAFIIQEYDIQNVRNKIWQNASVGFLADMDIGPANVPNYAAHDYATYDTVTRTAFVHNPVDRGSTPLGVTLLGASVPLDSVRLVFRWCDFMLHPGPGTNDSVIYSWMTCDSGVSRLDSNQSPSAMSDSRIYLGISGLTLQPGDSVKLYYALISGSTVQEMLNNAVRAQAKYDLAFVTGVEDQTQIMPHSFALYQNYPNPFNPTTKIKYKVQSTEYVSIKVYDVIGRLVATLVDEVKGPGEYTMHWDASAFGGLPSGVYFYRLEAGDYIETKKLLLMK